MIPVDSLLYKIDQKLNKLSTNEHQQIQPMLDCNHEEADTRIVIHVLHALKQGAKTVQVRTVDTDIVVILAGKFHYITY